MRPRVTALLSRFSIPAPFCDLSFANFAAILFPMKPFVWIPLWLAFAGYIHAEEMEDPITRIMSHTSVVDFITMRPPYSQLTALFFFGFIVASAVPKWRAKLYTRPPYFIAAALLPLAATLIGMLAGISGMYYMFTYGGLYCAPEYDLAEMILQRNLGFSCTTFCLIMGRIIFGRMHLQKPFVSPS
ncbi:hypothetical protein BH11VER1_BH11VER1_31150 [soil metagenome]